VSNPQKAKGDRAERDLVKYLGGWFPNVRRTKAGGEKDLGDLSGVVDRRGNTWCVQVADRRWRSHGELEAKAWTTQDQAACLGVEWWCFIAKRPGHKPADWFAYMPTWMLLDPDNPPGWRVETGPLACVPVVTWAGLIAPSAVR
jgi:hypothetical protein